MSREAEIAKRIDELRPVMDERMRRLWAGAEAMAYGRGGIAAVERATKMSRTSTISVPRVEVSY